MNKKRNYLLDAIRGFTMISMVLYHTSFDYFIVFSRNPDFLKYQWSFLWQQSICISFILLSGIVWPLGKKHAIKRGIILNLFGIIITFVTLIFMPEEFIFFGILNFIGCATLFMLPIDRLVNTIIGRNNIASTDHSDAASKHTADIICTIICLILFAITKRIPNGYIGTRNHIITMLPDSLYQSEALIPFGLPTKNFFSSDYFPLIPWLFMYMAGYNIGRIILNNNRFNELGSRRIPFLSWLGTKSLIVYLIHQPIAYAIVWLICR